MKQHDETVMARCPVCGQLVPMFVVHVTTKGWWRKRVRLSISGDATDYVAHIWMHTTGRNTQRTL
jgi:hypothetical protein